MPATTTRTNLPVGGTIEAGATVQVSLNNGPAQAATVNGTTWSLKVTGMKVFGVSLTPTSDRPYVFCKLETNQGIVGWGEGTLEWKTRAVVGCVEDLKPLVLGQDPTRIEFIWQIMYRHSFWRLGVIGTTAISAIEQACWDLTGKSLGVPV